MGAKKHSPFLDRPSLRIVSDAIRAELDGSALDWQRYRAQNVKRLALIDHLYETRFLKVEGRLCYATFHALVFATSKEAKNLLADLGRVYVVMVAHYRENLNEPIAIEEVGKRIRLEPARIASAVTFFQREGP